MVKIVDSVPPIKQYRTTDPEEYITPTDDTRYLVPTPKRVYQLWKFYKITIREYNKILKEQNFGCKICGAEYSDNNKRPLSVDHCHKTGKVRGLLCLRCNTSLAHIEANPVFLNKVSSYLEGK